ncbi:DNA topoisomerase VI subunit B [Candidatus Methanomassiliicoccus intestinalis]|jgi:DNA topoisomerase VI, B subunit|uniref:Type 2 DNA topoisomerase 6 subunit B n=2 Tax=Candidatus Methanomassiliicoccus intestinalis TaxID=1406512 RepID=R9T734_METII|nr:DNA topoisomerase VI subunit B [Candidatus Methanomassiliicoccus intestinalis]AGN26742.1 DNA topoisomerase VI subunit B [Candidatus Methanomassiliicoccus intestinalis Issoire-Mx1]TQS82868.1 MAG: DNA topoisomerase [Candidatus Methanomassiliicoccus intestinalis]TQS83722.1 MAG: DNA topoisomerase [Candidatus Methanomassiliicoccus intestinalis]
MPSKTTTTKTVKSQKDISVSEFFEKNRQILGFDSPVKSLLMGVKEAVDNSLDACEEARILPDILVEISKMDQKEYKVTIEDNGPGIPSAAMPNVFGRLLHGSRFHAVRQSRGQQGIGISATVMCAQITTGKPATARSKVKSAEAAKEIDIIIDTKKNTPVILREEYIPWNEKESGTRITFYMSGRYITGKQSIYEYLRQTAIVNPHASLTFIDPDGHKYIFERATNELPPQSKEIKPHPDGIELGTLMNMVNASSEKSLIKFLQNDFSRISERVAKEICSAAGITETTRLSTMDLEKCKQLQDGIGKVKIMAPQSDCLSPIGENLIRKGLKHVLSDIKPEYYAPPITRDPKSHSGNPFLVEVGIVYGGGLPSDQQVQILRFANRVPLLYQQGACAITKAIEATDWRRYGLEQRGGTGIPYGPAIILVHIASTKIPFTSEAKEAVSAIPQIQEEITLALKACGRSLRTHLNKKERKKKTRAKFEIVQVIIPLMAEKTANVLGKPIPDLRGTITKIMNVVWIDESITYDKGKHRAKITIYNYTPKNQKFKLHTVLPKEGTSLISYSLNPSEVKDDIKLTWDLPRIASTEIFEISFELNGLDKEAYEEMDIYVSNINPVDVMGADPLPGDWDLQGVNFTEVDMVPDVEISEEEDEEPDYDETEEDLYDE